MTTRRPSTPISFPQGGQPADPRHLLHRVVIGSIAQYEKGFDAAVDRIGGLSDAALDVLDESCDDYTETTDRFNKKYPGDAAGSLTVVKGQENANLLMADLVLDYNRTGSLPTRYVDGERIEIPLQDIQLMAQNPAVSDLVQAPSLRQSASDEIRNIPGLTNATRDQAARILGNFMKHFIGDNPPRFAGDGKFGKRFADAILAAMVDETRKPGSRSSGFGPAGEDKNDVFASIYNAKDLTITNAADVASLQRYKPVTDAMETNPFADVIPGPRQPEPSH